MGSGSFDLSDLLRSPEEIMATQREQMQKTQELERQLKEITGSATSEDERITVVYSEFNGLKELKLDPRVMRMPSDDLSAEIIRLVNEAKADGQSQIESLVQETFGEDGQPDPEQLTEQTAQLHMTMDELMRDTMQMEGDLTAIVERMRQMAGDDSPLPPPE